MPAQALLPELPAIILYSLLGTFASTFIIGYGTYAAAKLGWITGVGTSDPIEALLFGAMISAVNPVATLSIMGTPELNCDPLLYSLVFGESVLNDAVAIVLFRVFFQYYSQHEVTSNQIPGAVLEFVGVSIGSVGVGVLVGLGCAFLFKNTRISEHPTYEIGLLFLFAYGSYAFAESLELSGIMALFFCGIILAHYNSYNLSAVSRDTAEVTSKTLAQLAEYFVFLYMGMGFFTGSYTHWNASFIVFAVVLCLVSRLFNTFPLTVVANLRRPAGKKISLQMQVSY